MFQIRRSAKTAALLALGLGAIACMAGGPAARADDSHYYGGTNGIGLSHGFGNNEAPEVVVRNVAGNHHLQNLNLAIEGNTIAVNVVGTFACSGITSDNWKEREGFFLSAAALGIGRTSLLLSKALPDSSDINRHSGWGGNMFQMPVAMLGHSQVNVDPVAVVLAAAEQAPSKIDWLRQDHVLSVKIPLRGEAHCNGYIRNKITKNTIIAAASTSYLTKDVELKIVYKGDPQLFEMPNQLDAGDQPFKITEMTFQRNLPLYSGACPATVTLRVNYQGQGKGTMRIRVGHSVTPLHLSPQIAFDAKDGPQHYDFQVAIPEATPAELNKTLSRSLRLSVNPDWSNYQLMDTAVLKHRCTPQLNPALGGAAGAGKVGGYQNGGSGNGVSPVLQLKKPDPARPMSPQRLLPPSEGTPPAPTIRRIQ